MPKLPRSAKLVPTAERVPKTLMERANAGLDIIAHLILLSHFLPSPDSFLKVSETRSKKLAEQELIKTSMEQLSVNIVLVEVNAQISRCVGIKFARLVAILNSFHKQNALNVQQERIQMILVSQILTCVKIVSLSSTVQTLVSIVCRELFSAKKVNTVFFVQQVRSCSLVIVGLVTIQTFVQVVLRTFICATQVIIAQLALQRLSTSRITAFKISTVLGELQLRLVWKLVNL